MRLAGSTLVVLALLFCGAARAQDNSDATKNIFAALDARDIPAQLQGKNLTAAWRVMRADGSPEQAALMQVLGMQQQVQTSPWSGLYYTRGDVLAVSGQIYLVAYSVLQPQSDQERKRQEQFLRVLQDPESDVERKNRLIPFEENTQLVLSLISLEGSKSLSAIRAFDPDTDIIGTAKMTAIATKGEAKMMSATSRSNLKQVALGLMQYTQDYDEKLPPMRAAKHAADFESQMNLADTSNAPVQSLLFPYVKNSQIFLHPKTKRPYLPNYKVSRKSLAEIENPAATFAFYEDAPDADGKRNIAFMDGHVKAFSEAEFQKMRKAQGISQSGLPTAAKYKKPTAKKHRAKTGSRGQPVRSLSSGVRTSSNVAATVLPPRENERGKSLKKSGY